MGSERLVALALSGLALRCLVLLRLALVALLLHRLAGLVQGYRLGEVYEFVDGR